MEHNSVTYSYKRFSGDHVTYTIIFTVAAPPSCHAGDAIYLRYSYVSCKRHILSCWNSGDMRDAEK